MSKQCKCFACKYFEIFMEDIYIMGTDCELGNKICENCGIIICRSNEYIVTCK